MYLPCVLRATSNSDIENLRSRETASAIRPSTKSRGTRQRRAKSAVAQIQAGAAPRRVRLAVAARPPAE
jgi:hypothetical protein